jgi:hypothetical protein
MMATTIVLSNPTKNARRYVSVIGVGNKCLADVKPGAFSEKTETGGNSCPGKVINGIANATPHHHANRKDQQALKHKAADLGIIHH